MIRLFMANRDDIHRLLDALKNLLSVRTDAGLGRKLVVAGSTTSHIRRGCKKIGVPLLVRMCHTTGMSVN